MPRERTPTWAEGGYGTKPNVAISLAPLHFTVRDHSLPGRDRVSSNCRQVFHAVDGHHQRSVDHDDHPHESELHANHRRIHQRRLSAGSRQRRTVSGDRRNSVRRRLCESWPNRPSDCKRHDFGEWKLHNYGADRQCEAGVYENTTGHLFGSGTTSLNIGIASLTVVTSFPSLSGWVLLLLALTLAAIGLIRVS